MQRAKTLVFVVCAALLEAPAIDAQLSFTGVTRQLTTNPASQLDPAISGNLVVFTDLRNGNEDVYYYDLSSGTETQVTLSSANQRLNDVDGSRIVYTDLTAPGAHINLYDVTTGTTVPITSLSVGQNPRIDGDIVVFEQGPPTNPDVIAIDLGSGTEFPVAATAAVELWPVVSGRRVAYERRATPGDLTEIVVVDLDTMTEIAVLGDPALDDRRPDIDGNLVVWDVRTPAGDLDIVVHDLSTGISRPLTRPGNQRGAHVSGTVVAFDDDASGTSDVLLHDVELDLTEPIGTGLTTEFLNDIDGNRVVYTSNRAGNFDIWLFEFERAGQVLFGVEASTDGLSRIDPDTAQTELIGRLDPDPNKLVTPISMAIRPSDGQIFVWNNSDLDSRLGYLVTVDRCTGLATRLSSARYPVVLGGLAFSPDGRLWGIGGEFYELDPTTGEPRLVGNHWAPGELFALDSDAAGRLYGLGRTGSDWKNHLFTIDTGTGLATLVAELSEEVGTIGSIVFSPGGVLIGSSWLSSEFDFRVLLFDIDPNSGVVSNIRSTTLPNQPAQGMGSSHACPVDISPTALSFGDVELGDASTQIMTITNLGLQALEIEGISLPPGPFTASAPSLPFLIPAGETRDVSVTFAPSATGAATAVLHIQTSPLAIDVPLTGNGVPAELPPAEQIGAILEFFDAAVDDGSLVGEGSGNSAAGRLNALRNMIEAAGDLIQQGRTGEACRQLEDALERTDGDPRPPDFVTGDAATELARLIRALRSALGCG